MFEEILSRIGECLNRYNLPYMIIGGQAVLYIREWLKEFDASSDQKIFLKTFEELLKESMD